MTNEENATKSSWLDRVTRFLRDHALISMALGFAIGHSGAGFFESLIEGVIMPAIELVLGGEKWTTGTVTIGSLTIPWGEITADGIHFAVMLIIAAFVLRFLARRSH